MGEGNKLVSLTSCYSYISHRPYSVSSVNNTILFFGREEVMNMTKLTYYLCCWILCVQSVVARQRIRKYWFISMFSHQSNSNIPCWCKWIWSIQWFAKWLICSYNLRLAIWMQYYMNGSACSKRNHSRPILPLAAQYSTGR